MAKRFTETKKWEDPWFQDLDPTLKCVWGYILDHCDNAGVWVVNTKMAEFSIGAKLDWAAVFEAFAGRILPIDDGKKWWIRRFIEFQYGRLSRDCKPHLPILSLLEKHGISLSEVSQSTGPGKTHNVSADTRRKVLLRDAYECAYCGKVKDQALLVIDHVVPRKKGGDDKPKNLVAACIPCNSKKSDLLLSDFCLRYQLDHETIRQRVSERVSRRVRNTLQEEDKDLDKDQDQDKDPDLKSEDQDSIASDVPTESIRATKLTLLKAEFDDARKAFPGSKRGLDVEWENFRKKYSPPDVVPLLMAAIDRGKAYREGCVEVGAWCEHWPHFQTWINQARWTQEYGAIPAPQPGFRRPPTSRAQLEKNMQEALRGLEGEP